MADEANKLSDEEYFERNYSGHGRGIVITNENGKFVERQMTNAELWARKPALEIAADIHKLACYAAFAYIKCWELIAPVIQTAMSGRDAEIASLRASIAIKDKALEVAQGQFNSIKQATLDGKVCDDVAWYSDIETLHDFCWDCAEKISPSLEPQALHTAERKDG